MNSNIVSQNDLNWAVGGSAGQIQLHSYVGLFAQTGSGATIKDLVLDGTINLLAPGKPDDIYQGQTAKPTYSLNWSIGPLVAAHGEGTLTLDNAKVNTKLYLAPADSVTSLYAGGAVGNVSGGTVEVTDGRYAALFTPKMANTKTSVFYGGIIGYVSAPSSSVSFGAANATETVFLGLGPGDTGSAGFDNSGINSNTLSQYGGLIGGIAATSGTAFPHMVTVDSVEVDDLRVSSKTTDGVGGLLGYSWYNTNVNLNGVTLGNSGKTLFPQVASVSGSAAHFGGLVNKATGHWVVSGMTVNKAQFTNNKSGSTFGFLVNQGTYSDDSGKSSALYLELKNTTGTYDLSGVVVSGTDFSVFDEVVAYSVPKTGKITDNGGAVLSLQTTDRTDGETPYYEVTGSNTYQNQTDYGRNRAKASPIHNHSRYYYNLDHIAGKPVEDLSNGEKVLLWSLRQYGHACLSSFFNKTGDSIVESSNLTGTIDLRKLSYYPVSAAPTSISNATVIFDNETFEANEAADTTSGSVMDGRSRLSNAASQHMLMQSGLLYDVTGNLTVNNLTLEGNVGLIPSGDYQGSGFLVRGAITGSSSTSVTRGFTLNGAYVNGETNSDTIVAPLLINRIEGNTTSSTVLNLVDVSTTGYATAGQEGGLPEYAATSLIGKVGESDPNSINLSFESIALDARKTSSPDLSSYYGGAAHSIFSHATLLESFHYTSGSGTYNYTKAEDWGEDGNTPTHKVTYGWEVTYSEEFGGAEDQYSGHTGFTSPENGKAESPYDFDETKTLWLPYVSKPFNEATDYHEIQVNVSFTPITRGCGHYNDPFLIENGEQLVSLASILSGAKPNSGYTISIQNSQNPNASDGSGTHANHTEYKFNGSGFVKTSGSGAATLELDAVREYLAGAYYKIADSYEDENKETIEISSITLPAGFIGLGVVQSTDVTGGACPYAFRGVFDGNGKTIVNQSTVPLIVSSNGSVVKDLTLRATKPYVISQTASAPFAYAGGCAAYGAVIAKVMGGDNFLDNVNVEFSFTSGSITNANSPAADRLVPVGGYVGVVVNGTVVFRRMTDSETGLAKTGLTDSACDYVDNSGWLYVNPYVGRVIYGNVFSETVALDNSGKNYAIPVLSSQADAPSISTANSVTTVTVPNGQALWVLGATLSSGAGSASTASGAYATFTNAFLQGWRNYCAARIGGADYNDSAYTTDGTGAVTPYLVRAYGGGENSALRTVGTLTGVTVNITGDCTMPSGFRGLGSLYSTDSKMSLDLSTLSGGGKVICGDILFNDYDSAESTHYENYPTADGAGLGLLIWTPSALTVENLTLAGRVEFSKYLTSNGNESSYSNVNVDAARSLPAGMLVGWATKSLSLTNVKLGNGTVDATVKGARAGGGLVGCVKTGSVSITMTSCGTTEGSVVNVTAEGATGGLIGRMDSSSGSVTIQKQENASGSTLELGTIQKRSTQTVSVDFSGGGLIGFADLGNSASRLVKIEDMTVTGGTVKDNLTSVSNKIRVGGLIGSLYGAGVQVKDTTVSDVDLISVYHTGGFVGMIQRSSSLTVSGNSAVTASNGQKIKGTYSAGGLVGNVSNSAAFSGSFSGVRVEGYTIESSGGSNASGFMAAGGLVGSIDTATKLDMSDIMVKDCALTTRYSSENNQSKVGIGGLVGATGAVSSGLSGHNILITGLTMTQGSSALPGRGTLIGSNSGSAASPKLVGVSVQNVSLNGSSLYRGIGRESGNTTDEYYGTGGYVIYADYRGVSASNAANTSMSSFYNSVVDLVPAAPYVTVNPVYTIGTDTQIAVPVYAIGSDTVIVGDAFTAGTSYTCTVTENNQSVTHSSNYVPASVNQILTAGSGGTYRYSSDYQASFKKYVDHFSTFGSEVMVPDGFWDFPILVLEEGNAAKSTEMINSYLNLLANTNINYANDSAISGICSVTITRRVYDAEHHFFRDPQTPYLIRDGEAGTFYISNDGADNTGIQFTLIDVAYYDPKSYNAGSENNTVAYHLYVPILVKKLLRFNFDIGSATGTTYEPGAYMEGQAFRMFHVENLGTPATIYFRYSYLRTKSEWESAANNGEDLDRNYQKTLTVTPYGQGWSPFPEDTVLVLVDRQTGQPYYAHYGNAVTDGVLSLSAFKSKFSSDDSDGTDFEPVSFNDLLTVTAAEDPSGRFVSCEAESATITALLDETPTPFRPAVSGDAGTRYSFTVGGAENNDDVVPVEEAYYITFFTTLPDSENAIYHHFIFGTPSRLETSEQDYPTRRENDSQPTRLLLGVICRQDNLTVTVDGSVPELMRVDNNVLRVRLGVDVTVDPVAQANLGDYADDVYQSFLVYLTRQDGSSSRMIITGGPTASGSYSVSGTDHVSQGGSYSSYTVGGLSGNANYAEFTIPDKLSSLVTSGEGSTMHVSATVELRYPDSASIDAQFPIRMIKTDGVFVSASSHIAYNQEGTSRSKLATGIVDDTTKRYYSSEQLSEARLSFNALSDVSGDIAQLGINPNELDGKRQAMIETVGQLDYRGILSQVEDYDHVTFLVSLQQRQDKTYSFNLNLASYLDKMVLNNVAVSPPADSSQSNPLNCTEYSGTFTREETTSIGDGMLQVPLNLEVKTGAALEEKNTYYANYRITLTVQLKKGETVLASASNFIIYTNARVNPSFITS